MGIFIIILVIFLIFFLPYFYLTSGKKSLNNESVIAFVGGLGSGKTLLGVDTAIKLYKKNLRLYKRDLKKHKAVDTAPLLISNIPIFLNHECISTELTEDVILNKVKIPFGSILFLDEVGIIANQYEFKNEKVVNDLTIFIRLFRHITKGGYVIFTEQTLSSIVKPLRDRVNVVNYMSSTKSLYKLACCRFARISNTQFVESVTLSDLKDCQQKKFVMLKNSYDTYAYSSLLNYDKIYTPKKSLSKKVKNLIRITKFKDK